MDKNNIVKEIVEKDGIEYEVTKITNDSGEIVGMIENPYSKTTVPIETTEELTEEQNAIFETQANTEYLICMMEMQAI